MSSCKALVIVVISITVAATATATGISAIGPPQPLVTDGAPTYPTFSPDGASIVVATKTGADYDIYLIEVATGKTEPLIIGTGDQLYPNFYPEGDKLVYCSDETGSFELFLYDLNSGESSALTGNTPYDVRYPDISPTFWAGWDDDAPDEYRNIIYEADYGNYGEVFMAHDYGGDPVQLTMSANTAPGDIPKGEYTDSNYVDIECFKTLAPESLSYPRWDRGGFGFTAPAKSSSGTDSLYFDWDWSFAIEEILGPKNVRFCAPSGNYTQYLLMYPDGRIEIYDIRSDESFDVGSGDPACPPAISPDGKTIAYVKNGELVIQKLDNPLSEVTNLWKFAEGFAGNQLDKLSANDFVVTSKSYPNVVDAYYQYMGYDGATCPFFITSDSVLYLLYLYYDYLLRSIETEKLIPLVTDLCAAGVLETLAADDTAAADAKPYLNFARDYWLVASGLINPARKTATVSDAVRAEWNNIEAGSGASELVPGIDYTQFKVRGHYTASEELSNYFRTVMWLSQASLPMNPPGGQDPYAAEAMKLPSNNDEFVIKALVQTRLMTGEMQTEMDSFYDAIGLFIGAPESVDYRQLNGIMNDVYGKNPEYGELCDETNLPEVYSAIAELPPPKIVPQAGYTFAVLPQVFTPDAYILQKLVFPEVGTDANPRGLPKGLDFFAAMGEDRAYEILTDVYNADEYANYDDAFAAISEEVRKYGNDFWKSSLTYRWVDVLKSLTGEKDTRYPTFMQNIAWRDKSLMTALASWATMRHANILYAKGTGAYGSGGGPPEWPVAPKPKGYVEPNDRFYAKTLDMLETSRSELSDDGLWPERIMYDGEEYYYYGIYPDEYFDKMVGMLERLDEISGKELASKPLTDDDYDFINSYGYPLWELASFYQAATWTELPEEAYGDESGGGNITNYEAALIADIAFYFDPMTGSTYYLHEAIGRALDIYCVHPVESWLQISRGGVLSYYEFVEEGHRLNDDDWKGRLVGSAAGEDWALFSEVEDWEERRRLQDEYRAGLERDFAESGAPAMPEWTGSFYAPAVFTVIASALRIWDKPPNDDGVQIGTIREGDRVSWLGQEKWGGSGNHPDARFRWLLVELEDGRRVWCAQYGYLGDPVPTREVYLR